MFTRIVIRWTDPSTLEMKSRGFDNTESGRERAQWVVEWAEHTGLDFTVNCNPQTGERW